MKKQAGSPSFFDRFLVAFSSTQTPQDSFFTLYFHYVAHIYHLVQPLFKKEALYDTDNKEHVVASLTNRM